MPQPCYNCPSSNLQSPLWQVILVSSQLAGPIVVTPHNHIAYKYAFMTTKQFIDVYQRRLFCTTVFNIGRVNLHLPKYCMGCEVANTPIKMARIKNERYSCSLSLKLLAMTPFQCCKLKFRPQFEKKRITWGFLREMTRKPVRWTGERRYSFLASLKNTALPAWRCTQNLSAYGKKVSEL